MDELIKEYEGVSRNSVEYLYNRLKAKGHKITRQEIKEFLHDREEYQIQRPHNKKPHQTVVPNVKNEIWETDLTDMSTLSKHNKGYKWIMVVIDTLTKYLRVVPMKNKTNKTVVQGFKDIFAKGTKPACIYSDLGSEFTSQMFKDLLEHEQIRISYARVGGMAPNAERVIKSLRAILYKTFQQDNTLNWINIIDDVVKVYNSSINRNLKMSPDDAERKPDEARYNLYLRAWKLREKNSIETEFDIGDKVRVALKRRMFEKGIGSRFSKTIYTVEEMLPKREFGATKYRLSNNDERFGYELQKITKVVNKSEQNGSVEQRLHKANKEKRKSRKEKALSFEGAGNYWKGTMGQKTDVVVEIPVKGKKQL